MMKLIANLRNTLLYGLIATLLFTFAANEADAQRKKVRKKAQVHHAHKKRGIKKRRAAHWHYRHLPRWRATVTVVPKGAVVVTHRGIRFHYHAGVFYKPKGKSYVIVRPAPGLRIKVLPAGYRSIMIGSRVYFYYYGTFYVKAKDKEEYEVAEAPVGAQVDALPEGYEMQTIDGKEYYVLDEVYYTPVEDGGENDTLYEVVEKPER